jgi:hypothetical protein
MPQHRSTTRAWILALIPVVAIVGLMAWGFVALDSPGAPTVSDAPGTLGADPPPESTTEPVEPAPTPDRAPGAEGPLIDVEPIEDMPQPDGGAPLAFYLGDKGAVADVAYLGRRDIWYAFGLMSEHGDVCLWVNVADPVADPGISGAGTCAPYADFTEQGLAIEKGGWEVRWTADGTVEWID